MYKYTKNLIILSCQGKNESFIKKPLDFEDITDNEIESSSCFNYKVALITFGVFNLVRIISYYYEVMLFKTMNSCYMRQDFPCLHMGSMLATPYICYQLCHTFAVQYGGEFLFLYILSIAFIFVMYSYISGFINLVKNISYCLKNRYYSHWFQLYTSLIALFIYGSIILTTFIHLIFSIPSPIIIYGYPLYYPYINFPLVLFLMHHHIIRSHKEVSSILYKVIEEDVYIYARRFKCINGSICFRESNVFLLSTRPSVEMNIVWDTLSFNRIKVDSCYSNLISNQPVINKVVTVKNMDELDGWILKKLRYYIPEMKIEIAEKYY
ncbi:Hypothetical protein SRAE_2000201600 [Strongyloides ratti]|uniref:Uncharacterized protein n=1 Tax=Strongyloides ratti TaxID=34506 RepID=A0A090LC57_STRRB|nr:Hypothetical protein SRAE_2000201600 [Strongyloides ratti]CEF67352.1 Hypothetical protein SRAE_2000201600 [Strongyloides ratti]